MQLHDFLGQVQSKAQLGSTQDALMATRATLETLRDRLGGNEAGNLADQLPEELAEFLSHGELGGSERFSSDEFFERVSQRESVDLPIAAYHARVVFDVLQEAVSPGEIKKVRGQLPADYQRLFEAGSEGQMPSA